LGFESSGGGGGGCGDGVLAGKANGDKIPMADWTPEMQHEIKGAVEKLEASEFDACVRLYRLVGVPIS